MQPNFENTQPYHAKQLTTPIGTIIATSNNIGLLSIQFEDSIPEKPSIQTISAFTKGLNIHLDELENQLNAYFMGKRKEFELTLNPIGTPFQQKVWSELQKIPFGETRSYQQQTNMLGDPKAIRAVASANGKNPVAIVIPCHRIIGSDGSLTGYAGGLWRKKWLLDHEAKHSGMSYQSELGL